MPQKDTTASNEIGLLHAAMNLLPQAILIHSETQVLFANLATLELLGADDPAQLVGLPVSRIVHPDAAAAGAARRALLLEHGHAVSELPLKLVGVDGVSRYVSVSGRAIDYADGERAIMVIAQLLRVGDADTGVMPLA